jgi:hypothetical protein
MAFKIKSYLISNKAVELSIDNMPGVDFNVDNQQLDYSSVIGNLENLHNKCVAPILAHFNNLPNSSGNSIGITSAYRCRELNTAIKGASNSQHIYGMAVDMVYTEGHSSEVFNWAISNLPAWSQIIWEFPEKKGLQTWVHVSYNPEKNWNLKTLATDREDLHEFNKTSNTERSPSGTYTHNIKEADQTPV